MSRAPSLNQAFSLTLVCRGSDLRPHALEVSECVHVRPGALERLLDMDPQTMFERAQLLELLAMLERPVRQLGESQQRGDTIRVDTAMTARTRSL